MDEKRSISGHPIRAHALDGVLNDYLVDVVDDAFVVVKIDNAVCEKRFHVIKARRLKGMLLRPRPAVEIDALVRRVMRLKSVDQELRCETEMLLDGQHCRLRVQVVPRGRRVATGDEAQAAVLDVLKA